jgi:SSS family solute:Na+ symporter
VNIVLFIAIFTVLILFYTLLGFLASKNVTTVDDYFLANRNLGLWPVTFTLIATQLGGGMLLGTTENAYLYGLYGILYTVGMVLGFLLLSAGIASKLQSLNVATTAEIFETKYQSTTLKQIASFLSILTLCGLLVGQIVGSRSIIESIDIGASSELIFIGFWFFVILYTMVGGLKAVVVTDICQVLLIIAVFAGIFGYCVFFGPPFAWGSLAELQNTYFGAMPLSANIIIATLLMPAFFSLIEQDLAQRFFASRTKNIATLSALLSGIFMIFFALIPIYFGMQAKILGFVIAPGTSPLIPIIEYFTNDLMVILSLCAIIAAITSTADSLLCAISSNIAQDFSMNWFGIKNTLMRSQWITLGVGAIALGMSYIVPQNIIEILINSYAISVNCLLVPLLWAYFCKSVSKPAAIVSVLGGAIGMIIVPFWQTDLPKALLPLTISTLCYSAYLIFFQRRHQQ